MARGRGGPRDGVTGRNYANRTDLRGANVVAAQPQNQPGQKMAAQAASGQAYGAASAQMAAQKALPIANQSVANVPQAQAPQGQPMAQPNQPSAPLTPLFAATNFPNRPVTDGVASSPGLGPESLPTNSPVVAQYQTAKSIIQQMAADPNAGPAIAFLAQRINGAY